MTKLLKETETKSGCDFGLRLVPRRETNVLTGLSQCWRDDRRSREMPGVHRADSVCSHEAERLLFNGRLWGRYDSDRALQCQVSIEQVQQALLTSPASTTGPHECPRYLDSGPRAGN